MLHRRDPPQYQMGQKVWLETENLNIQRPSKKLWERQIGWYPIIEVKSSNTVQLKLPQSIKIHPVVNMSHVCPYVEPRIPQQTTTTPPPVEIEGEFEYEVEQVLDSRLYWGKLQYLIKWLGYMEEHNMWELADNLEHAQDAIDLFHQTHPSAPHRIRSLSPSLFWPIENFTDTPEGLQSILNCSGD